MRTVWPIALLVCGCWTSTATTPSEPTEPVVTSAPPPKLRAAPVDRFDRSTPRDALLSFLRAVELERFDVLLEFVPDVYRAKLSEDQLRTQFSHPATREAIERLRHHSMDPITENGPTATMQYGSHYKLELVREANGWRIKDLD